MASEGTNGTVDDRRSDKTPRSTSRRDVLRTAAVGAALTAGAVALPTAAGAATGGRGASGAAGTTEFAFVGRIDQDGGDFLGYGFLTEVAGVPDDVLFGDVLDRTEASAQLTIAGDVTLERRSVRGNVFVLDGVGTLAIHQLSSPGADFADAASFSAGTVVARYDMALHDVLTVIAPNEGIPTLSGELEQTAATNFTLGENRYRIGSKGTRLTLDGTGHGLRTDAQLPRAQIDLAARVSIV